MIRVAIVDDQAIVRQGIESLLALSGEVEVVGTAQDGEEALQLLREVGVDVVLLDLQMPGLDGIATMRSLQYRGEPPPVLVLTTFDDPELVLAALRAGAKGYLLKDVTLDQLLDAIRTLAAGGTMHIPSLTNRLLEAMDKLAEDRLAPLAVEPLTGRESDVLRLVAGGLSNAEIAEALDLAAGTVKNHVSSILLKLGVRDRTQAVLKGLQRGII